MDFSSLETWIDIIVIIIAVVSCVVAVRTARDLLSSNSPPKSEEKPPLVAAGATKKAAVSKKPSVTPSKTIEPAKQPKPKAKKAVFDQLTNAARSQAASPSSVSSKKPPRLIPERLTLKAGDTLVLTLKNDGDTLIYKKMRAGENNELNVAYSPSSKSPKAVREEFKQGNSISFALNGSSVVNKTYQFTIFFSDKQGNQFSQEVAGLGKEYPIVNKPVKIA